MQGRNFSPNSPKVGSMTALSSRLFKQQCYVNGQWVNEHSGQTINVTNPATGEILGTVPKMGANETAEAIEAARVAQKSWAAKTGKERAGIMRNWFDLIMKNQNVLAELLTLEMGKPLTEAKGEIAYGASFIEWFSEEAKRTYGEIIPGHQPDKRIHVLRQPIGVTAAITPWNFPNAMITRKAGAALAAGCSMVVKPATATPYSALALCVLAEEAGVPAGVLSVLTGSSTAIGGEMTSNPTVRKLSFTGSTEVGALLMAQCAKTIKKTSMELGGNAPFIVFDDADLDAAVEGVIMSKFRNNGQTCVCANRIYVQAGVYDAFTEKLIAGIKTMKVGNGMENGVAFGPMIDQSGLDKVKEHIVDATSKGAKVVLGGNNHELGGLFFQPTILTGVDNSMMVTHDETFGPMAPLFRFENEDDVIAQANDTRFGLASYFYSSDLSRVHKVSEALEYGIVGVNTGIISTEVAPFGGVKESGIGREGSRHGIDDYMELKYVCLSV